MNCVKCYDCATRARNPTDYCKSCAPTLLSAKFYEHHAQDCRVKFIRSNVAQTLGSSNANSVGVSGNNPIVLTVRTHR